MLSKYIASRQAYFNPSHQQITLSYTPQEIYIDALEEEYQSVKSLVLTHCHLTSLEGIEQFQNLEELNVKFNQITEVSQLFRIKNKELINRLQFTGNDIEYLGAGLFINLVQIFPNLIELNGKNYFSIVHKNTNKHKQMKKIVAHSQKLQKQMINTIRKADLHTKQYKRHTESRLENNRSNIPTQRDQSKQKAEQKSRQFQCTSKKQKSMAYSQRSETEQKQNLNNGNNQNEYDVSLGDISNIPMAKSIRGSYINLTHSQAKQNKKKGLQIFTLNESLQANRQPLSQPTATFAMQRQKENSQAPNNLMFRNREKQRYKNQQDAIEQYGFQSKAQYERPTKRQTYQSFSDEPNQSWDSSLIENNLIRQQKINIDQQNLLFSQTFFKKNLLEKAFYSWKHRPCEKNLPMKRQFI